MDQVFSLQGWTSQTNKNSVDFSVDLFGKGKNPWKEESLAGVDSLDKFSTLWARYSICKPTPNKKAQKCALIYGLAMVSRELNSQVSLLKQQTEQALAEKQQLKQQGERQAAEEQLATAKINSLTLQVSQLEQQLRNLNTRVTDAETAAEIKGRELQESQAVVRQLLKEAHNVNLGSVNHVACNRRIDKLQKQLQLAKGVMSAIEMNPLAAFKSEFQESSSDSETEDSPPGPSVGKRLEPSAPHSSEEAMLVDRGCPLAPIVTQYDNNRPPTVKHETRALTPEQTRALGKQMGICNKETVLNWLAKLSATPNVSQEEMVALLRECMSAEDFAVLPYGIMVDTNTEQHTLYKRGFLNCTFLMITYWVKHMLKSKCQMNDQKGIWCEKNCYSG
ncbi:uncharacterized protein LOC128824510 [Malaclemys terrapin pileata]|uniref:uncharacterized protein LOC128824510 n=1 Tax=Malaclemys terrapin pileata TaxID=2991368 RepID=UPI0023A7EB39|nr:uncharacterized protein LOC128824510 [Malaclemys terrapin pileata]XP_053862068.1 uncharacterized protein LOC128824510 [Malaclemys terrapin pileata]